MLAFDQSTLLFGSPVVIAYDQNEVVEREQKTKVIFLWCFRSFMMKDPPMGLARPGLALCFCSGCVCVDPVVSEISIGTK